MCVHTVVGARKINSCIRFVFAEAELAEHVFRTPALVFPPRVQRLLIQMETARVRAFYETAAVRAPARRNSISFPIKKLWTSIRNLHDYNVDIRYTWHKKYRTFNMLM